MSKVSAVFRVTDLEVLHDAHNRARNYLRKVFNDPYFRALGGGVELPQQTAAFNLGMELLPQSFQQHDGNSVVVSSTLHPVLKSVLMIARREIAIETADKRSRVNDPTLHQKLGERLDKLTHLMKEKWFQETCPAILPQIQEFLTTEEVEKQSKVALPPRQFDEKFHILQAPSLITKDLDFYRDRCGMRDLSVSVAFLDIDDFKKLNTDFDYLNVDRHFLPQFMSKLEALVFGRGHAYRLGGDEYVMVLPNTTTSEARRLVEDFQFKLLLLANEVVTRSATISVGIYELFPGDHLTNEEAVEQAEQAKTAAKNKKKGSIGFYVATFPLNDEGPRLVVVPPSSSTDEIDGQ